MIRSFLLGCAVVLGMTGLATAGSVVNQQFFSSVPTGLEAVASTTVERMMVPAIPVEAETIAVLPFEEPIRRDLTWPTGVTLIRPPTDSYNRMRGEFAFPATNTPVFIPVLMYHHIRPLTANLTAEEKRYSVDPQIFRAQILSLLRAGFTPIHLETFEKAVLANDASLLPEKPVLLTFDDGFRSQYQHVFPLLKEARIPATFFVLSQGHEAIYLTKAMMKEMATSTYVDFAAHTRRHAALTRVSAAQRWQEIYGAKTELETLLGLTIRAFAYPYGAWNTTVIADVQRAGYTLGFSVRLGSEQGSASRWQLRRIPVTNGWDMTPIVERFLLPPRVTIPPKPAITSP